MKAVFSTGEAAEICQVSQQTIIRCFDSGRLKGFKVPGSRFRRIPRPSLIAFMKDHGIPMDALDSGKQKVLIVGDSITSIGDALKKDGRFDLKQAASGYEAGMLTQDFLPDTVILGTMDSPAEQLAICKSIKANPELAHIRVVVAGKVTSSHADHLSKAGANAILEGAVTGEKVIQQLWSVTV